MTEGMKGRMPAQKSYKENRKNKVSAYKNKLISAIVAEVMAKYVTSCYNYLRLRNFF